MKTPGFIFMIDHKLCALIGTAIGLRGVDASLSAITPLLRAALLLLQVAIAVLTLILLWKKFKKTK